MSVSEDSSPSAKVELATAPTADMVFIWEITSGTRRNQQIDPSEDFSAVSGTFSIPAGQTAATFILPLQRDAVYEGLETFIVKISPRDPAKTEFVTTFVLKVQEDITEPTIQFSASSQSVNESSGTFEATLVSSSASIDPMTVTLVVGGTSSSVDRTMTKLTYVIPAGSTSVPVSGSIINDSSTESTETLILAIATLVGDSGKIGISETHTVSILDDDGSTSPTPTPTPGSTSLSIADVSVSEAIANASLVVTLSAVSTSTVTVQYATEAGTATATSDYTTTTGTLTFTPGQTTATIAVPLASDTNYETNETFNVRLSSATDATISDDLAVVTITNDDPAPSAPAPTNLTLVTATPNNDTTPTVRVHGAAVGDIASLYTDSACTNSSIGSATSVGTTVDVTVSSALASGSHDIYARLENAAAQVSSCSSMKVTYVLDTDPPTSPTISIDGGAASTALVKVDLALSAVGATQMYVTRSSATCASGGSWGSYSTSWAGFAHLTASGTATISVKFRDAVGNESACVSDSIAITYVPTAAAHFPINGGQWLDYVQDTNKTVNTAPWNLNDYSCDETDPQTEHDTCVHAGEIRKVVVPEPSCGGLSATDALGVFDWTCFEDIDGFPALYSRLKAGKGLKDLILADGSNWKDNSVTVTGGLVTHTTASSKWWPDIVSPVVPSTSTVTTLSTRGVYAVTANASTAGFNITAHKVAVVVLPGVTLSRTYNANCNASTGASSGADSCMFLASNVDFSWIEGVWASTSANTDHIIYGHTSRYFRAHGVTVEGSAYRGIYVKNSRAFVITHLLGGSTTPITIQIENSQGGQVIDSQVACRSETWSICLSLSNGSSANDVTNTTLIANGGIGLDISNSNGNFIKGVRVESGSLTPSNGRGVVLYDSDNNYLNNISVSNFQGDPDLYLGRGILITNTSNSNSIHRFKINNVSSGGLTISNTSRANLITGGLITNVGYYGILVENDAYENVVHSTTVMNVSVTGTGLIGDGLIVARDAHDNTFSQLLISNIGRTGIQLADAQSNQFMNNTILHTAGSAVTLALAPSTSLKGWLALGSIGAAVNKCVVDGSSDGLTDTTCAASFADGQALTAGSSNGTLRTGLGTPGTSSWMNFDSENDSPHTSSGVAANAITDWSNFEFWFRAIGKEESGYPNSDTRGGCFSGNCRILNWALSSGDTVLLNKSGDAVNANTAFTGGATCPAAVHGNYVTTTTVLGTTHTYLTNALEIVEVPNLLQYEYPANNNNGFCESGETCSFMPNAGGAYQGENFIDRSNGACVFVDGVVTGVTIYPYVANGNSP